MAVNQVVYAGNTLIDLRNDTVTPGALALGVTAHSASGETITGTASVLGTLDASANLMLTGALDNGTYTVQYTDANGNVISVGTFKIGYTNLADPSSSDWQEGYRLSSSGALSAADYGNAVANFIPCKAGDVVRVKGINIAYYNSNSSGTQSRTYMRYYASTTSSSVFAIIPADNTSVFVNDGDTWTFTVGNGLSGDTSTIAYIRPYGAYYDGYTKDNVVITVNEEITGNGENTISYNTTYGTIARVGGTDYSMYMDVGTTGYRAVYQTTGEVPYYNGSDLATFTSYYPLSVPSGKTKVSITLPNITSSQTLYMAVFGMTLSGNIYTRSYNSGWLSAGVYECEFGADIPYIGVHFRNSDYSGLSSYDFGGVTVTWS